MKTLTRTLIASAAILAVGASAFAITASTRPSDISVVDAPLTVPSSTLETVSVLGAVADGALAEGVDPEEITAEAAGLSEAIGSAVVTVPDAEPAPEGEVGPVAPEIVAAAAALDAAAGDASDLVTLEDPTPADPATTADPATPASDPCALIDGALPEECPEGVRARLLSLTGSGELQVWAMADAATGPDMGTSIYCTSAETAGSPLPERALRLGAITTGEATVTVTYWPDDNPSATTSAELTQVQVTVDGSARHCGLTTPLDEGRYSGLAIAVGPRGEIADAWPLSFDSRGAETIPPMSVVPLGTNWLWVGVRHTGIETASIKGFELTDGGITTCAEAAPRDFYGLRADIPDHTSEVSREWLAARNFNGAFTRVTSALLYVPEGTSVAVCGYTFKNAEPSWDIAVPDRIQMVTAAAPDTWEAVVAVESVTTRRPGNVYFSGLTQTGGWCGSGGAVTVPAAGESGPLITPVSTELCRISGQNMQVELETFATDGSQDPTLTPRVRFMIPTRSCTGTCPEPAPRTYNVYMPSLGTDRCVPSAEGDCRVARSRLGASATISVTWDAGSGGGRESWDVGGAAEQEVENPSSAGLQFDVTAFSDGSLSTDGLLATMSTTLRWDRAVSYSARIVGTCFGRDGASAAPAPATGSSLPRSAGVFSAAVSFGNLCPGHTYQLVVTTTDDAGNTVVASPAGVPGVTPDVLWYHGEATMPQQFIELTATIELTKNARVNNAWLVRDTQLNILDTRVNPSLGYYLRGRCFGADASARTSDPATVRLPLAASYDIQPAINVVSDWYYYPTSPTCEWRASSMWTSPTGVTVSLSHLLAGTQFTGNLVPVSFPDADEDPVPFTYRVTLRAELVED